MNASLSENKRSNIITLLGGTLLSISMTLVLILVFALFIRFFDISNNLIFPINQVIKVISLFFGISMVVRKLNTNGLKNGIILAFTYYIFNYLIFSILQGNFSFGLGNLYDAILTTIIGGLIGIILVNLRKK